METILHNLSEVFAVSIIHSLWQCLLIYLVLRILFAGPVRFSAAARYNIGVASLYYITLWFIYTLFDQASNYSWHISPSAKFTAQPHLPLITTLKHFSAVSDRYEITIEHLLPYITIAYIAGVVFHSLRLTTSWIQLQQLKKSLTESRQLQQTVDNLRLKLRLKKQVLAGYAERIDIPCIAGYLKPVIMLPLATTSYLSAKEIESILLHELAHVKRNDYFINALQQVIVVIFFFNPFVYLINRMVNLQRENACDDMVIDITNEPLVYAQALLKIEQHNVARLPLALAATGKKYHLLTRIERIMKTKNPTTNLRQLLAAVTILIASSLSLAWFNPAIGNGKLTIKKIVPAKIFAAIADTTPSLPPPPKQPKLKRPKTPTPPKPLKDGYGYHYHSDFSDPKLEEMGKQMEAYGKQIEAYYNNAGYKKMQESMEKAGKEMEAYYNNPNFKQNQQEMEKLGKQIQDYYNNDKYKALQKRMEEVGKEMGAYYDNPDVKKVSADMEKAGKDYGAAYGDGKDMEKIGKQMEAAGKKMSAYYESPEFKAKATELQKKYKVPAIYSYEEKDQDPNVQAYLAELNSYKPKEVADAQEEMKTLGKQMRDHFNSPAIKEANRRMKASGDAMRNAFSNPRIKELQNEMRDLGRQMGDAKNNPAMEKLKERMRELGAHEGTDPQIKDAQQKIQKLGEEMRDYGNNPQIKEVQQKMKELGKEMRDYTKTPEFKKKQQEWQKTHPDEYNDGK